MVEITTLRMWIGITIAWLLLSMLVFDRWFFFSPLGLLIIFGLPIAGWVFWWKYFRQEGQQIALQDKFSVGKSIALLKNLKKHITNQQ